MLGPRLYRGLAKAPGAREADPEAMHYLSELDDANRERNGRLLAQLRELAGAFAVVGLEPVVLKGGAELLRVEPQGTTPRMLRDLDLMIRPDQAGAADTVLRALGYDRFEDDPGAHSAGTYFRPTDVGAVDLHVALPALFAPLLPPHETEAHTERLRVGDGALRVPDASLQFVVNIGHDMLHDEAVVSGIVRLAYLVELADLAADRAAPLDWPWILGKCRSRKFRLGLETQARLARQIGLGEFRDIPETGLGGLLHRRRLSKLAWPRLGEVEWQALRWAKDLRHIKATRPPNRPPPADDSAQAMAGPSCGAVRRSGMSRFNQSCPSR